MKQLVTKRSYKIGLSAMALVLLMTTAGGAATAHASTDTYSVETQGETKVYRLLENSAESFAQGGIVLKPVNNSTTKSSETKSWFASFWSSVKTFWEAFCRGVGWCK
ncbi:SSU0592/SSU0593 family protein [Streptococcus suis]